MIWAQTPARSAISVSSQPKNRRSGEASLPPKMTKTGASISKDRICHPKPAKPALIASLIRLPQPFKECHNFSILSTKSSKLANLRSSHQETKVSKSQKGLSVPREWTWRTLWRPASRFLESHLRKKSKSDSEERALVISKVPCEKSHGSPCRSVSRENTSQPSRWPAKWLRVSWRIFPRTGPNLSARRVSLRDLKKSLSGRGSSWLSLMAMSFRSTRTPWTAFHRLWVRSFSRRGAQTRLMRLFEVSDSTEFVFF